MVEAERITFWILAGMMALAVVNILILPLKLLKGMDFLGTIRDCICWKIAQLGQRP
jgi:hypothetical protein